MLQSRMNYKSLQFKILVIFMIPVSVLIYFSYFLVNSKYQEFQKSSLDSLSAQITYSSIDLVHNIQLERGLSAGYIVSKNIKRKKVLNEQYKKTDASYTHLLSYINGNSQETKAFYTILGQNNKEYVTKIVDKFHFINSIRKKVFDSDITFQNEIDYYTDINEKLFDIISILMGYNSGNQNNYALVQLQQRKEMLGLIRAHIYNQLLSNYNNEEIIIKTRDLEISQKILHKEFYAHANILSKALYNKEIDTNIYKKFQKIKKDFFLKKLTTKDANKWFDISTLYINQIELISNNMLHTFVNTTNEKQQQAKNSMYISMILWIFSILALLALFYILKRLIDKEKQMVDELKIASYTFDSHEAMTITDVKGTILQVNNAFSDITGYSRDDVIGQNPNILNSDRHTPKFFQDMWDDIRIVGRWSGEIYNKRKNGEIYPEKLSITAIKNNDEVITHYIAQFIDITDLKEAQILAEYQANHDFLTKLPNRKALIEKLDKEFSNAVRQNHLAAFLFIDLDNFKAVNDNYGHYIGDKLLVEITAKVQILLRKEDIFSRLSGDEFAIIMLNLNINRDKEAAEVKDKCEKILKELSKKIYIDGYEIKTGASIGIKIFPNNEKSSQDIIKHADISMYQAKSNGKNNYVFFDKSIEIKMQETTLLENEIDIAVKENQFEFYMQPKVKVDNGTICGAETLIRWNHPTKGILYPDSFLEVLNGMGLISQITRLALYSTCEFISKNQDIFYGTISINIDSEELLKPNFEDDILSIISEYGIEPNRIELEILEDNLIEDFDKVIEKMNLLKKQGLKFSIDDFGTGYSSITYLSRLPVDYLKIDRHFIFNLNKKENQELVKMMIHMANVFKMKVIIEGVENIEHLKFIKDCGADIYQGYYYSKPVSADSFIKLLNTNQ